MRARRGPDLGSALVALAAVLVVLVGLVAVTAVAARAQPEVRSEPGVGAEGTSLPPGSEITRPAVPLPGQTVAPIPSLDSQPGPTRNDLDVTDVYVAPSLDPDNPDVVVQFAAPFALPAATYKVSVLVGDPNGQRLRASLVSTNPAETPTGLVERGDGTTWQQEGPASVTFDPAGFIVIDVAHTTAPDGDAVWVEINVGNMATATRTTPYYSRAGFFHTAPEGALPGGRVARILDAGGSLAPRAALLDDASVLRVADGRIEVDAPAPSAELLGLPVERATDTVLLTPDYDDGGHRPNRIVIDWTARTITLRAGASPDADLSGDRSWVVAGFPEAAAGSTGSSVPPSEVAFSFDLATISSDLGVALDPSTYGIGLTRTYSLRDGRQVIADGLLGSQQFFDRRPIDLPDDPAPAAAAPTPSATTTDAPGALIVAAGVGAAVVLGAVAVLLSRRRRRRRALDAEPVTVGPPTGEDRVPWARADGARTATAEMERLRVVTGAVPVVVIDEEPSPAPVVDVVAPTDADDPGGAADEVAAAEDGAADVEDDADEVEDAADEVEDGAEVVAADVEHGADVEALPPGHEPSDVLAALDGDLSSFKSRLDALDESPAHPTG